MTTAEEILNIVRGECPELEWMHPTGYDCIYAKDTLILVYVEPPSFLRPRSDFVLRRSNAMTFVHAARGRLAVHVAELLSPTELDRNEGARRLKARVDLLRAAEGVEAAARRLEHVLQENAKREAHAREDLCQAQGHLAQLQAAVVSSETT